MRNCIVQTFDAYQLYNHNAIIQWDDHLLYADCHWRITLISRLSSKPAVRLRNRKIVEDNIGGRDSRYPASLHMSLTWSSICGLWDWKSAAAVVLGTTHHLQYQCGSSAQASCLRDQYCAVVACGVEVTGDKVGSQVGSGCITELVHAEFKHVDAPISSTTNLVSKILTSCPADEVDQINMRGWGAQLAFLLVKMFHTLYWKPDYTIELVDAGFL